LEPFPASKLPPIATVTAKGEHAAFLPLASLINRVNSFGYINFETVEQATEAIKNMSDRAFEGRTIKANYVINKPTFNKPMNPESKTLFIGNLAFEMSDADLNNLFREVRNVVDVRVAIDRRTGQPRGFAHADFVDVESAKKGLAYLQGKEIYNRVLRVDFSGVATGRGDRDAPQF
jgi:nucleolin